MPELPIGTRAARPPCVSPYLPAGAEFLELYVSTPPLFSLRSQGETTPSLPAGFRKRIPT